MSGPDHAVRELTVARPRLRRDVRFTYQDQNGEASYIVEDLTHRRYFQAGLPEYQFLRCLDGTRTAREVLAQNARDFGEKALSENDAVTLLRWLIDQQMLETDSADQSGRRYRHTHEQGEKKKKFNLQKIFFFRMPMGNPDKVFQTLQPWLGWTATVPFFAVWVAMLVWAGFLLAQNWDAFIRSSAAAILPQNWLILGLIFITLKLIHEIWHGVVTRKFGGIIPEWGIQLLVFITPLTYVDASASWRMSSRWHRIFVAAAGMFIELFLAAIAVVVWTRTEPGMVNTIAHNTIFAASTVTLLFNANPLMRFDGYYILSDLLRIPNLGTRGQQFFNWMMRHFIYDVQDYPLPPSLRDHTVIIATYGILAFLWRVLIWIGIMVMASLLFKGAGRALVIMTVVGLISTTIYKAVKFLAVGEGGVRPHLGRAFLRMGLIAASIAALLTFVKIDPSPRAVAVVDFPEKSILRADAGGFVEEIFIEDGTKVDEGELLLRLDNRQEVTRLQQLELDEANSQLRARRYFEEGQLAAFQAEQENLKGLQERLRVSRDLVESLEVRAPVAGVVHARRLESMPGRFLQPGSPILAVIPETPPQILVSVRQEESNALSPGSLIKVRLRGHPGTLEARLDRIESRATTEVPHPALASSAGGPLLVRQRVRDLSDRDQGLAYQREGQFDQELDFAGLGEQEQQRTAQELTKARFALWATLEDPNHVLEIDPLLEGEWGFARLSNRANQALGAWLYEKLSLYVTKQMEQAGG